MKHVKNKMDISDFVSDLLKKDGKIQWHDFKQPQKQYEFANSDWASFYAKTQSRNNLRPPSSFHENELHFTVRNEDNQNSYPLADAARRHTDHLISKNWPMEEVIYDLQRKISKSRNPVTFPIQPYPVQQRSQTVSSNIKDSQLQIDLKARLEVEKAIVARELPQFTFHQQNNSASYEGWQITKTSSDKFYLKLVISQWYPDQMPNLYITSPHLLKKYGSGTINEMNSVRAFHTLNNGPDGCVQICYAPKNWWDASKTCTGVLFKGILWTEAYSIHLLTGMTIDEIFKQWERRQK